MVDVSGKAPTERTAVAAGLVRMHADTRSRIEHRAFAKGDVLAVAELAGIMAAKRTADLIPLCHPIPLTQVQVRCRFVDPPHGTLSRAGKGAKQTAWLRIEAKVKTTYQTGVEMEALTACTAAALTVYDMCKSVDRGMVIESVALMHKSGGKSGTYERVDEPYQREGADA
ncbi:cyclic pyranopterin monophosphate synthase MoaC [Alicyclobacillus cycloheptanicus]|nr:cyclic pyranopterin monophosphate synthase MoaC [Alicyclobacillus cycloheptanicus]WDM03089.1 cyclic pyranopterin monophosphate synthase MoaC [Alicyclobacillus cycloheptanicus]